MGRGGPPGPPLCRGLVTRAGRDDLVEDLPGGARRAGGLLMTCRLCGSTDLVSVVDLGAPPPCELFLTEAQLDEPEMTYPLHLRVCTSCWLAQLPPLITPEETFNEDAYLSSYSPSRGQTAPTVV